MVCGLRAVIVNWNVTKNAAGRAEIDPGAAGCVGTGHLMEAAR